MLSLLIYFSNQIIICSSLDVLYTYFLNLCKLMKKE